MAKIGVIIILLLVTSCFIVGAGTSTTIGTKKLDDCIDLIQTCADCTYVNFSSYTMPNGTRTVTDWAGVKSGSSFTYNNCNLTNQLGTWIIDGIGDVEGTDTVFTYSYDVTLTGNPTPDGMPMFQMGLIIVIFGISCFLLFLSSQMDQAGFKIFFLVTSLIFLIATMLTAYMVSIDGNVAATTNATTLGLVFVLSMILIIVFIYILIMQTLSAIEMMRIKQGTSWNPGGVDLGRGY